MYLSFTKTDPNDAGFEERCENILRTVTIAQTVSLNQTVSVSSGDYASDEGREFDIYFRLLDGMSVSESGEGPYLEFMPNVKGIFTTRTGRPSGRCRPYRPAFP